MSRRSLRLWVSVGLIVLGTSCGVPAEEVGDPPVRVAGVVLAPEKRSAILVILDGEHKDVGLMTLREGESISGYRLAAVEPTRVLLERDGKVFPVPVGRPKTGLTGVPEIDPLAERRPIFIPGPDKPTPDLEFKRDNARRRPGAGASGVPTGAAPSDSAAVQDVLQRIFGNPGLQQRIDESRPMMRQRLEREKQERFEKGTGD